jgi:hypothetical protein
LLQKKPGRPVKKVLSDPANPTGLNFRHSAFVKKLPMALKIRSFP